MEAWILGLYSVFEIFVWVRMGGIGVELGRDGIWGGIGLKTAWQPNASAPMLHFQFSSAVIGRYGTRPEEDVS